MGESREQEMKEGGEIMDHDMLFSSFGRRGKRSGRKREGKGESRAEAKGKKGNGENQDKLVHQDARSGNVILQAYAMCPEY